MTPIIRAMIEALGGFGFDNRHSSEEIRRELRRILRIVNSRNENSRYNEIPASRDHSNDLRFVEP